MFAPVVLLLSLVAQIVSQSPSAADGLTLLKEIGRRYAEAQSYHIEAIEERTSSNELHRDWQKTLLTAIVMPGGRYRYQGRSGFGSAILVSDGTTKWDYRRNEHLYTQQPASVVDEDKHYFSDPGELVVERARHLNSEMAKLSRQLKFATLLPDETILLNGRSIDCYVIRYGPDDFRVKQPADNHVTSTIWIDKARKVVVQTREQGQTYMMVGERVHIPISQDDVTIYPFTEFDPQEPASTFKFVPPADAKLIAAFPKPSFEAELEASSLIGKPAPELSLKSADGKIVTLSSFRGKPVFLEFWATWCAPCVDLIPELTKLYSETANKGLVWLSIDSDEDPATAASFLAQEHVPWPNYHDGGGSLGKAFHLDGIPFGVLIDADGKITFQRSGYEIPELRNAIAKLGAQFSSVASSASKPQ